MIKKKVFIHILGARPNFIKASPLIQALKKYDVVNKILHTGQHYDYTMSEQFFKEFKLPKPFCNLDIGSLNHGAQTGRMLEEIEKVLNKNKSDFIVIYGDTNSTVAGALAAVKLNIPIAHIESGVRTKNYKSPEEINRKICDHIATVNFSPTIMSYKNLKKEGLEGRRIFCAGDVMYDMVINAKLKKPDLKLPDKYILVTIHRQENTDNITFLKRIFSTLIKLSKNICVLLPLHPRTKKKLIDANLYEKVKDNLNIIDPQSYSNLLYLIKKSEIVISDSGGVPKEAAFLDVPSIFIGDNIVWQELFDQNWTLLISPRNVQDILFNYNEFKKSVQRKRIQGFGEGSAAVKIAEILYNYDKGNKLD